MARPPHALCACRFFAGKNERATHDLRLEKYAAAAPQAFLRHPVFMGRPDKPGDDDPGGDD
jgi:hypothetical protein